MQYLILKGLFSSKIHSHITWVLYTAILGLYPSDLDLLSLHSKERMIASYHGKVQMLWYRFVSIIILLSVIGYNIQSQNAPALVGGQFDYSNAGKGYNTGTGINIEGWFGDHFSLNYSFLYGPIGPDEYYLYTGGGQAAGVYIIKKAIKERSGLGLAIPIGVISFVLPESLTFRFGIARKSQVGLVLAPYGFEFVKNRATGEEDYNISYELAGRYYLAANHWIYIIPQIGMKGIYDENEWGVSFGLSLMFKTKDRNQH